MSFWDSVKQVAAKATSAAVVAGQKAQLNTEIMLADREIRGLKQKFGVDLYNHLGPLTNSPDFFAADDSLTAVLRPPLLAAQREIAALEIRRRKTKENIKQAEVKRAAAFPDKAITFADKAKNAAKSAALAGNEAKLSTDLSVIENQMTHFKQKFGEEIFEVFVNLEDTKGWLPTDRTIRSMYDQARQNVEKTTKRRKDKIAELENLGGTYVAEKKSTGYDAPTAPATPGVPVAPSAGLADPMTAQPSMMTTTTAPAASSSFSAAPPPAAPMFTDPKVQGLFATPDNPPPPDMFAAVTTPAPSSSMGTGTSGFGSSNMHTMPITTTPGYTDSMGSFTNSGPNVMGGFSDNPPMGGAAGTGFSNPSPPMGGFSDFPSGTGGGFGQQQPNNAFGFPNTQSTSGGSNTQQQKPPGQPDDLLSF